MASDFASKGEMSGSCATQARERAGARARSSGDICTECATFEPQAVRAASSVTRRRCGNARESAIDDAGLVARVLRALS